ncbi:MAG: acyl-CoA dehydrogenase family protein, partial [Gemmatimonadaceae bacterium]|nr:acyl-CoA dehydrogenase family protein [Acetobacteraceae bacterium]
MDLSFTAEERAFRERMRDFFHTQIPASIRDQVQRGEHVPRADQIASQRILNAAGLAVPHWPAAWGGQDWSPVQLYIYQDEMQQACVPPPLGFNTNMVGPVIAQFGSEAQKQQFLPATANLDIWWCQGFSEPGAGSDLASLRGSAVRGGDGDVVNGQKTWTTRAQYADGLFCLV